MGSNWAHAVVGQSNRRIKMSNEFNIPADLYPFESNLADYVV